MPKLPKNIRKAIDEVKEFSTDGCSKAPEFDFLDCCLEHDFRYKYAYGTRKRADKYLRECIKKQGHPVKAWIYWSAVRLLGWRSWGSKLEEAKKKGEIK